MTAPSQKPGSVPIKPQNALLMWIPRLARLPAIFFLRGLLVYSLRDTILGVHGVPEVPSVFDCILAGFSLHGLLESTIILISWLVLRFAFQTATNKALRRIRLSRSAMFWIQFAFSLLLSVIVYPVMLVERRWILQEFLLPYEERSANVWTLVARIYSREGFAGFFAGWIEMSIVLYVLPAVFAWMEDPRTLVVQEACLIMAAVLGTRGTVRSWDEPFSLAGSLQGMLVELASLGLTPLALLMNVALAAAYHNGCEVVQRSIVFVISQALPAAVDSPAAVRAAAPTKPVQQPETAKKEE